MRTDDAIQKLRDVIRRKHFSVSTEDAYCGRLRRFCSYIKKLPVELPNERRIEPFLAALAKDDVSVSTQNQAFNALAFFYREILGVELEGVHSPRAKSPVRVRHAPSRADTLRLMQPIQSRAHFDVTIVPHELRHAYATHRLTRGTNPRAIQEVMGHKSLQTTMGYLHAEPLAVASPLDVTA